MVLNRNLRECVRRGLAMRGAIQRASSAPERAELVAALFAAVAEIQRSGFQQNYLEVRCPKEPGCWACCCELVEAGETEIELAARYLKHAPGREEVMGQLEAWTGELARLRAEDKTEPMAYITERLRCPFLLHGTNACAIYPARPGPCRTYVSTDGPEVCHEALVSGRFTQLSRPSVEEAAVICFLSLATGRTFVFQEGVAYRLGILASEPPALHDFDPLVELLAKVVQGEHRGWKNR